MSLSLWDTLPNEIKVKIFGYAPEHRNLFNLCLDEFHKNNHKKKYAAVMEDFLYEWYDDDGYLNMCDNEYCERPIEKGNEIWETIIGNEYCFCCDHCLGLGSWSIAYDYRKYYRHHIKSS